MFMEIHSLNKRIVPSLRSLQNILWFGEASNRGEKMEKAKIWATHGSYTYLDLSAVLSEDREAHGGMNHT